MFDIFTWSDDYSVGVSAIDAQHRSLFELGNRLATVPLIESKGVVIEMFAYIRKHFSSEENHMREIGYPKLNEHKSLHDKLISDLNKSISTGITTEDEFTAFKSFIYDWLTNHIMVEDKKYFDYSRIKQST